MTRSDSYAEKASDRTALVRPRLESRKLADLHLDPRNPRKHSRQQIKAIAKSIKEFGFNAPVLIDGTDTIVAGHGRALAAQYLGLEEVSVVRLDHLSETQAKAYQLADNKLTDRSTWDDQMVGSILKELTEADLNFDIEATGFEPPEIDFRIHSLDDPDGADAADEFEPVDGPAVSQTGDLWELGPHRLLCGSALEATSYERLLGDDLAAAVITDPPYNVKIDGHVCGSGSVKHREFAMASGELSAAEFTRFLTDMFGLVALHAKQGALGYFFMDWRHIYELHAACSAVGYAQINLCVWVKSNGGMGAFYRSRHELVAVYRNGSCTHLNNVQLGRFGRNRTNVWHHPGVTAPPRKGRKSLLELHPTVKPVRLIADAIQDCTRREDIVLDPFIGSGTTILAAERTGRRCFGLELDPVYVDTAIKRWERMSGRIARHASGASFKELKAERGAR